MGRASEPRSGVPRLRCLFQDNLGKLVPVSLATRRHVIRATAFCPCHRYVGSCVNLLECFDGGTRNFAAPRWCANLVMDNSELLTLRRQAQNRQQKILAACRIQPGGAKNQMIHT